MYLWSGVLPDKLAIFEPTIWQSLTLGSHAASVVLKCIVYCNSNQNIEQSGSVLGSRMILNNI